VVCEKKDCVMCLISLVKRVLLGCFLSVASTLLPDQRANLQKNFDDVLLVVNYNHPYYKSIDFLTSVYSLVFKNIVFYGEKRVFVGESPDYRVHTVSHNKGWYGYRSLADAMKRYPHFSGYLYTNDDCFLNFWNLVRFDKNKIWINEIKPAKLELDAIAPTDWPWWSRECGYQAIKKVYAQLPDKYVKTLARNGGEHTVFTGMGDMVYIPAFYREATIELCALCSAQEVFLEVGLPTIYASIAGKENWEIFNALYMWYDIDRDEVAKCYKSSFDGVHPFKFSYKELQEFIADQVNQALFEKELCACQID